MKRKRIDIITLGCSKNLVDSEQLMRQLEEVGYSVTHDTETPQGKLQLSIRAVSSEMPKKNPSI